MIIIAAILYLVLSSVLNVCRGGGFFRKERKNYFKLPKAVTSILQGVCTGILFIFSGLPMVVCAISIAIHAACVLLWASPGWGKYFGVFTGWDRSHEEEVNWIDYIINKQLAKHPESKLWYGIGMTLRGLYYLPCYIALAFIDIRVLYAIPFLFSQGLIYGLVGRIFFPKSDPIIWIEVVMGVVFIALPVVFTVLLRGF